MSQENDDEYWEKLGVPLDMAKDMIEIGHEKQEVDNMTPREIGKFSNEKDTYRFILVERQKPGCIEKLLVAIERESKNAMGESSWHAVREVPVHSSGDLGKYTDRSSIKDVEALCGALLSFTMPASRIKHPTERNSV